jgi:uncharacterized protein
VLDTPAVQRLRYVRQLGHAFLVYPGATHTRLEHALGTYHLARRALSMLEDQGGRGRQAAEEDGTVIRLAALLHDVGHYPFSHALEEAGFPHHETLAERHLESPALKAALQAFRLPALGSRLLDLIRGTSPSPLAGLISGSLDLDKVEYLTRDAWMCGVPYGAIDADRLLTSLTVLELRAGGLQVGIHEKGISALESLLFSKYQMYRNVYWHHAVRSATSMFKRLVTTAVGAGVVTHEMVAQAGDDDLTNELMNKDQTGLARALRDRHLAKRVLDIPATELPTDPPDWTAGDPDLVGLVEDALARELTVPAGTVFLDFPAKPAMLSIDLPVVRRDGRVESLSAENSAELMGLPRVSAELYRSARRLRLFSLETVTVKREALIGLVMRPAEEVRRSVKEGKALLR